MVCGLFWWMWPLPATPPESGACHNGRNSEIQYIPLCPHVLHLGPNPKSPFPGNICDKKHQQLTFALKCPCSVYFLYLSFWRPLMWNLSSVCMAIVHNLWQLIKHFGLLVLLLAKNIWSIADWSNINTLATSGYRSIVAWTWNRGRILVQPDQDQVK